MAPGDPCPRCGLDLGLVAMAWKTPVEVRPACVGIGGNRSCGWSRPEAAGMVDRRGNAAHAPALAGAVGDRVRRRRELKAWSQHRLAREAGMTPGAVSRIEAGGRMPSLLTVAALAAALGCRPGELVP